MAYVRDNDTSLWLHNKLGTGNDLWSGRSICSHLNQDVLRNIKDCFIDLQPQVKLKLLLSFMHIPRRNVDEWKVEMEEILELAIADSDQWVSMQGELLKAFPETGTVNVEIEENARVFTELINELKKMMKKHSDFTMTPMESLYLNKTALASVIGQTPQPVKHFALKRKPKSAALRAELLQKSTDAASNVKNSSTPGIPIRSRCLAKRMDDTTPLKGFSSRTPTSGFRGSPALHRLNSVPSTIPNRGLPSKPVVGRKDGGIKLLDITEQPIGFGREAKRRKKLPGTDEVGDPTKKEKDAQANQSPVPASTPEYAAGLISSPTSTPLPSIKSPLASLASPSESIPTTPITPTTPISTVVTPITANAITTTTVASNVSVTTTVTTVPPIVPMAARIQVAQPTTILLTKQATISTPGLQTNASGTPQPPTVLQMVTKPQINSIQTPGTQPQLQKKGLSLTKEQMQEAQAMFLTANKVTRPEKALILGFMAGARDNPCPHLGNIVTIKLSEDQETITQSDGTQVPMMAEMHFQMNYNTGEWKRVKKYKKIEVS